MLPLDDILVVDFTKLIAGPLCTQYLGDMGADIIKIEDLERGDDLRGMPPFVGTDGAMFFCMNRNKRSVALDLKTPEGLDLALQLIAKADVLVESYGTGVTERLGIGHVAMRKLNPRLVYCSVSGFGRSGPLGPRPGFELMMQAYSGMMMTTGDKESGPLRIGFSPLDQTTGIHAATGIVAALRMRDRSGEGSYVEASLFETAMGFMGWHAQAYWMNGALPERPGSGHGSLCPYQAFMASDGYILLAVGSDLLWRKFCDVVGLQDYRDEPRFKTNATRVVNAAETVGLVQDAIGKRSVDAWIEVMNAAGIPASPVNNIDRALADPQTAARHIVMDYEHPVGGAMKAVAHPVLFEGAERVVRRPPPLHGEHTEDVLRELGVNDEALEALRHKGAIGLANHSETTV
jgi:crotonobetainyl-CoA:carnitine CoA-transferase CaiB-like acyl-CoA transferase